MLQGIVNSSTKTITTNGYKGIYVSFDVHAISKHFPSCNKMPKTDVAYIQLCKKYKLTFVNECLPYVELIKDVFVNDNLSYLNEDSDKVTLNIYGLYYSEKLKDYAKSKECHELVVRKYNSSVAMQQLGRYYCLYEKDYDKAKYYHNLAYETDKTCNGSMSMLGSYYTNIEKNYEKGMECYHKAIERGSIWAMFNIAVIYEELGNYEMSIKYYLMAIENKHSGAMVNLGSYYDRLQDPDTALIYYQMSVKYNQVYGMVCAGNVYRKRKNYDEMCKYYFMAIERDCTNAMICYSTYLFIIKRDKELGTKYLVKALEMGDNHSLATLKIFFKNTPKNLTELYNILYKLENKSKEVLDELYAIKCKVFDINYEFNKNAENVKECIICNENEIHLQFICGHEVCCNCFKKMGNKCFYRCNCKM